VKIAGVPTYESITAPAGYAVTSSLQTDGTKSWTITESGSTVGTSLSGLTLFSSYTGSDQPVATFTVTASNTTSGEAATSAPQTLTVIDPPIIASNGGSSVGPGIAASPQDSEHIDRVLALMDQFTAAGFHKNQTGLDTIASAPDPNGAREHLAFLAMPTHLQSWAHS
jgi:hypothetical protein